MGILVVAAWVALVVAGCGSSEPDHAVKPISGPPPANNDLKNLSTADEKIKYIQNSNAPESEKKKAIAQIQAGKL